MAGIEASFSAKLSSDMMNLPTVSMGLVCQAVSSSLGVVTFKQHRVGRRSRRGEKKMEFSIEYGYQINLCPIKKDKKKTVKRTLEISKKKRKSI